MWQRRVSGRPCLEKSPTTAAQKSAADTTTTVQDTDSLLCACCAHARAFRMSRRSESSSQLLAKRG